MPLTTQLSRLDGVIWATIGAIAAFVAAAATIGNFTIAWLSFAAPAAACAALTAAAGYYLRHRGEPKIASALGGTAQMIAFTAVGAPLSYLAASANFPLHDHLFTGFDRALGLDWKALLAWINEHAEIHFAFAAAYFSFTAQVITIVLVLAFANKLVQLRIFMLALIFSAVICITVSAVLPAEGVWGFYKISPADHPAIVPATRELHLTTFFGLRDGTYRNLVALGSEGIITFPSFHAALGVVFIAAIWPVAFLRWIGLAVNSLMIAATPIDGGHYFVDVIAGIAIAIVCVAAARTIAYRLAAPSALPLTAATTYEAAE
jgi:membrane-associated phospholipid phosphatase